MNTNKIARMVTWLEHHAQQGTIVCIVACLAAVVAQNAIAAGVSGILAVAFLLLLVDEDDD
jgi:hypothetical protein